MLYPRTEVFRFLPRTATPRPPRIDNMLLNITSSRTGKIKLRLNLRQKQSVVWTDCGRGKCTKNPCTHANVFNVFMIDNWRLELETKSSVCPSSSYISRKQKAKQTLAIKSMRAQNENSIFSIWKTSKAFSISEKYILSISVRAVI